MFPPLFSIATSSASVKALLGSDPTRLFLFGEATQATPKPYAVWQTVSGSPENYLGCLPDADKLTTQVDCYGTTVSSARAVAKALSDALTADLRCYVTQWNGETKDTETNLFRVGFDVDWIEYRA